MTATPETWCTGDGPAPRTSYDPRLLQKLASVVCRSGWRAWWITGMLRDVLVRHFAQALTIEDPDLRHLIWRPDERSRILVESYFRARPSMLGKRPAVLIKRNARQRLKMTIGNRAGIDERGQELFTTWWVGSHTVFCLHGSGASVEMLADEVQRELTQFGPKILQYLGLHQFDVLQVDEIHEIEESKEHFMVPITVGWAFEERWALEEESLKTYKISVQALLNGMASELFN